MYQGKRDFFSKGYYKRRKRKRCRAYSTFWNALFKFMIIYNMICVQTQSTYSFVPKSDLDETIDHISSSSHSTILSRQYDSSSSVLSYGSIFVLELKQPNVQLTINSIDIMTIRTSFFDVEVWSFEGSYEIQMGPDHLDLKKWTKSCCDVPVQGRGKEHFTSIPREIFKPIVINGHIGVTELSLFVRLRHRGLISTFVEKVGYHDNNLLSTSANKIAPTLTHFDIHLGASVGKSPSDLEITNNDQVLWNGVLHYDISAINIETKNNVLSQLKQDIPRRHQDNVYHRSTVRKFRIPNGSTVAANVEPGSDEMCRQMHQVKTPVVGATEAFGIMFDVVPTQNAILETLEFRSKMKRGEPIYYIVFAKFGSHVKSENEKNDWTKLSEGALISAGWSRLTGIPGSEFTRVSLVAGQTYALYIATNTSDILYGRGEERGKPYVEDKNIQILEGTGMGEYPPFGLKMFSPRVFQGSLVYSSLESCGDAPSAPNVVISKVPTLAPTLAPTSCKSMHSIATEFGERRSASFGIMFDVTSKERLIQVESLQVYSNNEAGGLLKYIIYSKDGSYRRFETNPSIWSKISEGVTPSEGPDALTVLPIAPMERVFINKSSTRAFYITFQTTDLLYSKGIQEGEPYISDDHIQILEGVAITEFPPFGTSIVAPRLFQGVLQYSFQEDCLTPIPTLAPSLYHSEPPSQAPHLQHSEQPTLLPTKATLDPTSFPSYFPTSFPSYFPSRYPTMVPSTISSEPPTTIQTEKPSTSPSELFTVFPSETVHTVSSKPTVEVNPLTSLEPSNQPTKERLPSSFPLSITASPSLEQRMSSIDSSSIPSLMPIALSHTKTNFNGSDSKDEEQENDDFVNTIKGLLNVTTTLSSDDENPHIEKSNVSSVAFRFTITDSSDGSKRFDDISLELQTSMNRTLQKFLSSDQSLDSESQLHDIVTKKSDFKDENICKF